MKSQMERKSSDLSTGIFQDFKNLFPTDIKLMFIDLNEIFHPTDQTISRR